MTSIECPLCTLAQCKLTVCTLKDPFACITGLAQGGCASSPATWKDVCSECCNVNSCESGCPPCSFLECTKFSCPAASHFVCTKGTAVGGCGGSTTWKGVPSCDSCCDLSQCGAPPTSHPTVPPPSNRCPPCSRSICSSRPLPCPANVPGVCLDGPMKGGCDTPHGFANNSACSSCCDATNCYTNPSFNCTHSCGVECDAPFRCQADHPYMCTEGEDKRGCHESPSYWPTLFSGCSACCDARTCIVPCQKQCTPEQCAKYHCSISAPFTCVLGNLAGGCAPIESYFPQQSGCKSCCDYRSCGDEFRV